MRRGMYGEYDQTKGQVVEIGGGGYEQDGNIEIKQEQAIHIHVHINIGQDVKLEEIAETPSLSWLGKLIERIMLKKQDNDMELPAAINILLVICI